MKSLFIILCLLPAVAFMQPEKTNLIIIKGVSFKQVVNAVLDAGYSINRKDDTYHTLRTDLLPLTDRSGWTMSLDIRVKDSTCYLKGYCYWVDPAVAINSPNMFIRAAASGDLVGNYGHRKSLMRMSFVRMNEFALSHHGEINYQVK